MWNKADSASSFQFKNRAILIKQLGYSRLQTMTWLSDQLDMSSSAYDTAIESKTHLRLDLCLHWLKCCGNKTTSDSFSSTKVPTSDALYWIPLLSFKNSLKNANQGRRHPCGFQRCLISHSLDLLLILHSVWCLMNSVTCRVHKTVKSTNVSISELDIGTKILSKLLHNTQQTTEIWSTESIS